MTTMMPGYYDNLVHQQDVMPEWQRIERYEYCDIENGAKKASFMDKLAGLFRRK